MKLLAVAGALVALAGAGAWAAHPAAPHASFPEGPPLAHTGGFGEPDCSACHFDGAVNDSLGALSLSGVPKRYTPGKSYRLLVTLEHPGLERGGFELAARYAAGPAVGEQAGVLKPLAAAAAVSAPQGSNVQYAHQTLAGSSATAGVASWEIRWAAPAQGESPVVFHIAANAGNGDQSQFGDWIYTDSVLSKPGSYSPSSR